MRPSVIPFTPILVTLVALTTYLVITILLLVIHFIPPRNIPTNSAQVESRISVVDAWHDLQHITGDVGYHPYNSRANDRVKEYLLRRVDEILRENKVERSEEYLGVVVQVVDDLTSNVTFAQEVKGGTTYFEGTNLVVVVKGTHHDTGIGGVLVNAHYDSVSTGYGATDDGMAVVSLLQMISYFTNPNISFDKRPKRDILFLFNNGEEDYLNGARAFAVSPFGHAPKIFYNLEGAGAGGRSTLFRSTDTEVTSFYKRVKRPFGISVSADGFKKGLVRSQTDYKVFTEDMGMRGLDVAFWRPRSRYHTQDDDVRHTSRESLWHMLGGAIKAVEGMASDTSKQFEEGFEVGGTDSVWFDMFGRAFVLLKLHTLFAISVLLLVTTPLIILGTIYSLYRSNKLYMFSNAPLNGKSTHGWKGFFVYPIAFTFATSAVIGTAFLFVKVNPMTVYGNLYLVWTCFLSEWFLVAWVISKIGQWWRGSALTRAYSFGWMWLGWWGVLTYTAILEDQKGVSGGYFALFYYAGAFLAFWISLLELFSLPPKDLTPITTTDASGALSPSASYESERASNHNISAEEALDCPTETSPLLNSRRGSANSSSRGRRPWPRFSRRYVDVDDESSGTGNDSDASEGDNAVNRKGVYKYEQRWSRHMPTGWGTWVVQWLLSVPVQIILAGQIGLFLGEALGMTGADGSNILTIYLGIALFSILYLLPLLPFLHRITHHLAYLSIFLFLTCLIYNLAAFPFTPSARLKIYFQQTLDLSTGENVVSLVGVEDYIKLVINKELPSAYGKEVTCKEDSFRSGLHRCWWNGLPPRVAEGDPKEWVKFSVTRTGERQASFEVVGKETRNCKILFDIPVMDLKVIGGDGDNGFGTSPVATTTMGASRKSPYPGHYPDSHGNMNTHKPDFFDRSPIYPGGTTALRLWSREWNRGWTVDVAWGNDTFSPTDMREWEEKLTGNVTCMWADVNEKGLIPAYDELMAFFPVWAVPSKLTDGLLEASWPFSV